MAMVQTMQTEVGGGNATWRPRTGDREHRGRLTSIRLPGRQPAVP
jgi:hypothetical protein